MECLTRMLVNMHNCPSAERLEMLMHSPLFQKSLCGVKACLLGCTSLIAVQQQLCWRFADPAEAQSRRSHRELN